VPDDGRHAAPTCFYWRDTWQSIRRSGPAPVGVDQAQIDEGLRAHMNKVYATMSGGMLITAAAAWAIANLAVTSDPTGATVALREGQYLTGLGETLYTTPLRWVVMFAPLAFLLFGWGALMRRGSAAASASASSPSPRRWASR
jgi:FtsH-binding integral membrane protein